MEAFTTVFFIRSRGVVRGGNSGKISTIKLISVALRDSIFCVVMTLTMEAVYGMGCPGANKIVKKPRAPEKKSRPAVRVATDSI
jgi:hypothetical protein